MFEQLCLRSCFRRACLLRAISPHPSLPRVTRRSARATCASWCWTRRTACWTWVRKGTCSGAKIALARAQNSIGPSGTALPGPGCSAMLGPPVPAPRQRGAHRATHQTPATVLKPPHSKRRTPTTTTSLQSLRLRAAAARDCRRAAALHGPGGGVPSDVHVLGHMARGSAFRGWARARGWLRLGFRVGVRGKGLWVGIWLG